MKAVIFCGGLGKRLREETEFRPEKKKKAEMNRINHGLHR
jgi:hypothetical protein